MKYTYKTSGTCSSGIEIEIENNIIQDVKFVGGCNGNLKGIGALTKGMTCDEVIEKCSGINCNNRKTSCPDQLAKALIYIKTNM